MTAKTTPGLLHGRGQFLGLVEIERHRLVAQHVEAGLDGFLGNRKVRVVGRRDADEIDPAVGGQGALLVDQLIDAAVSPIGSDVVSRGRLFGLRGIGRERAGHEHGPIVEDGRRSVDPADERTLSAADQAHPQLALQVIRWSSPSQPPGVNLLTTQRKGPRIPLQTHAVQGQCPCTRCGRPAL